LSGKNYLKKRNYLQKEIRDYPIRGEISFSNLVEDESSWT
jgi:hypothetical protein